MSEIRFTDRLTERQNEVLQGFFTDHPKITILYGAVRSGKTFIAAVLFVLMVLSNKNKGYNFILGGVSISSIELNVLQVIESFLGTSIKKTYMSSFDLFGNHIICLNGGDAASWKKARGFTAKGAYLNEATALHDSFVKEVIARCSLPDSRILMDTNPDNPQHFVNQDYIKKSGQRLKTGRLNIKAYHFTLYDNTFLDPEYIESLEKSTPPGVFTERNILGRWVSPEGLIYTNFTDRHILSSDYYTEYSKYYVAVDYGTQNPCVFLLFGKHRNEWHIIKEYYYNGRKLRKQKTDDEYLKDLQGFIGDIPVTSIIIDPSATSFITAVRQLDKWKIRKAKNKILKGIMEVSNYLQRKELKVYDTCNRTIEEFYNYSWDEESIKRGDERPKKENDHAMDAIRYFVNTILVQNGVKVGMYESEGLF